MEDFGGPLTAFGEFINMVIWWFEKLLKKLRRKL
jgi:hypothetical protein